MAHYAFLDQDNIVTEVIVGIDENETIGGLSPEEWYGQYRGQKCLRTSYHSTIRYNFAAIGAKYDPNDDAFISIKPQCNHISLLLTEQKRWVCQECDECEVVYDTTETL